MRIIYTYQPETLHLDATYPGTVDSQSHMLGVSNAEPILIALDSLLRYAKAHNGRYELPLCDDRVLGAAWMAALDGIHALLDGDGAVAMERNRTTDSKSNSACEAVYWSARKSA